MLKKIAVIEGSYARDTQIFDGYPNISDNVSGDDENWVPVKYPCHYIGVFEGNSDDEIRRAAADSAHVHAGVITLIDI